MKYSEQGYALIGVVVFIVVILVAGMAFFAMASYETRQAVYRQSSSEAFYLADAALERARAKFLEDRTWRGDWNGVEIGNGSYDLAMRDSTYLGIDAIHLLATGRVGRAVRQIEVMADIPPSVFGLALIIMGDATVTGNICIEGPNVHVNGEGDFGPDGVHLTCGEFTEGFELTPPYIHTTPDHFPNTTYYYVRGHQDGATDYARIYDEFGNDLTATSPDSLEAVTSYDPAMQSFQYTFNSHPYIETYFNDVTGVFRRQAGDAAVVVNFGESPLLDPPGALGVSNIEFDSNANTTINATIVNTRFIGVTDDQRIDTNFWMGGLVTVKQINFEPFIGLAFIVHDFQKQGGANVQIGTEDWPAMLYATGDVFDLNANYMHTGAFLTLGNWTSSGGPQITFSAALLDNLPSWFVEEWIEGTSGTLQILSWREMAGSV